MVTTTISENKGLLESIVIENADYLGKVPGFKEVIEYFENNEEINLSCYFLYQLENSGLPAIVKQVNLKSNDLYSARGIFLYDGAAAPERSQLRNLPGFYLYKYENKNNLFFEVPKDLKLEKPYDFTKIWQETKEILENYN